MNPLDAAGDIVKAALKAGADEAECVAGQSAHLSVDIEGGRISMASSDDATGFGLRVISKGRLGFASTSNLAALARLPEDALRVARHSAAKGYHLPAPGKFVDAEAFDQRVAKLDVQDAMDAAETLLGTWQELAPDMRFPGGGISMGHGASGIVSSTGVSHAHRGTQLSMSVSLVTGDEQSISAWDSESDPFWSLEPKTLVERTVGRLESLRNPKTPERTGAVPLIFSPEAAVELLGGFVGNAVTGDDAKRGNSPWSALLDQQVANEGLSIVDDPTDMRGHGPSPTDGEGVPTTKRALVKDGVLQTFIYDSWDAHEHGETTTGNALRGDATSMPSTGIHHMILDHKETHELDALLERAGNGYLVDSVLGAHTANPTTGEFSITAANLWGIKDGAHDTSMKSVAISGNVPDLLRGAVAASRERRVLGGSVVPYLLVEGLQVSL